MSIKQIISDWVKELDSGSLPFFEYEISNGTDTTIISTKLELQKHSMAFYFNTLGGNDLHLDGLTRVVRRGKNGTIYAKIALKHFDNIDRVLDHIIADVITYIYDNGYYEA